MSKEEAIEILSEMRSEYNLFGDEDEATRYHVLSMAIQSMKAAEVVRCKDCKYRIVNEHYGEKGYMKIEAMCELDTGDPFELGRDAWEDDWFCADGERKEE